MYAKLDYKLFKREGRLFEREGRIFEREGRIFEREGRLFEGGASIREGGAFIREGGAFIREGGESIRERATFHGNSVCKVNFPNKVVTIFECKYPIYINLNYISGITIFSTHCDHQKYFRNLYSFESLGTSELSLSTMYVNVIL